MPAHNPPLHKGPLISVQEKPASYKPEGRTLFILPIQGKMKD